MSKVEKAPGTAVAATTGIGAKGATVAAEGQAKPRGSAKPKADIAGIAVSGAALGLVRGPKVTQADRELRAKALLEVLRGGDDEQLTFGGRVKNDLDAALTVRNFFPSHDVARRLVQRDGIFLGAALEFLDHVAPPEDLQPILEAAILADTEDAGHGGMAGARPQPRKPPGEPLGRVATWANNPQQLWAEIQRSNVEALRCDDATLRVAMPQWGANIATCMNYGDAQFKLEVIRFFARVRELDIIKDIGAAQLANYVAQLPTTVEAAAAIYRLAAAYGLDVSGLELGGRKLPDWAREPQVAKWARFAVRRDRQVAAAGGVRTWENDANHNNIYAAFRQGNADVGRVSEATVRKWFSVWGVNGDLGAYQNEGTPESRLALAHLWIRGKQLGLAQPTVGAGNIRSFMARLPATSEAAAAMLLVARVFGVDLGAHPLGNGATLAERGRQADVQRLLRRLGATLKAGAQRPERRIQVRGELGDNARWEREATHNNFWAAKQAGDASTGAVTDATVRQAFVTWNWNRELSAYVGYGSPDTRLGFLKLWARARELNLVAATISWPAFPKIIQNIPQDARGAQAALRACRAFGQDPAAYQFAGKPLAAWADDAEVKKLDRASHRPRLAAQPARRVKVARGALGAVATWEHEPNHHKMWAAWQQGTTAIGEVSDLTVDKWFGAWGLGSQDISAYLNYGSYEFRGLVIKFFARAKERGLAAPVNFAQLRQTVQGYPSSPETAAAVRRLGLAHGTPVEDFRFNDGRSVADFVGRRTPVEGAGLPEREALGAATYSASEAKKLIEQRDPRVFEVDDATLARLVQWGSLADLAAVSATPEWIVGVLRSVQRRLALKGAVAVSPADVSALVRGIAAVALNHESVGAAIVETLERAGLPLSSQALADGSTTGTHAVVKVAATQLSRRLEGASAEVLPRRKTKDDVHGPIGNVAGPHNAHWNSRAVTFTQLVDAVWTNELPDGAQVQAWLNQIQSPRVFLVFARIAELNPQRQAPLHIRQYLAQPVPVQFVTDESVPWIARMAKAGGVDPATVRVMLANGSGIVLTDHPAFPKASPPQTSQHAEALAEDLALLDPAAKKHDADREGALMRLFSLVDAERDPELAHELHELVPALLGAEKAGKLSRVDLEKAPAKHRRHVLETAFERWDHPGAIAVLAGLAFKVGAADIEALLLKKGQVPAEARRLARVAHELGKLAGPDLEFALAPVVEDVRSPDFTALPLRLLLSRGKVDRKELRELFEGAEPHTFVAAVMGRAMALPEGDEQAGLLAAFVHDLVLEGAVAREDVSACMDDATREAVEARVRIGVERAVESVVQSKEADREEAERRLVAVLTASASFVEVDELAKGVLEKLYARDLEHVAALGATDEAAGGVKGKAWNVAAAAMRGPEDKSVEIAGVALDREGRAPTGGDVVMPPELATGTGERNLRVLATRWLMGNPMVLGGAGAGDMDAAVRYLAESTEVPYARLQVTSQTSLTELAPLIDAAVARGATLHLVGQDEWPAGLGALLGKASATGARWIAQGDATAPLPGASVVPMRALDAADRAQVLQAVHGKDCPRPMVLAEIFHELQVAAAEGSLGEPAPRFSTDQLDRVVARVKALDSGDVALDVLVRRELEEVMIHGLPEAARDTAIEIVEAQLPLDNFEPYKRLEARLTPTAVVLGDVELATAKPVKSLPALTRSTLTSLYCLAKALKQGERVALPGGDTRALLELYSTLTGAELAAHCVTAATSAAEVLGAGQRGLVYLQNFEVASGELRAAVESAALRGEIQLVVGIGDDALAPRGFTAVRVATAESEDEQAEIARRVAREVGLPEAFGVSVLELQGWVRERDAAEDAKVPTAVDVEALRAALSLMARLMPRMGLSAAYLAAVEALYGGTTAEQTDEVLAVARRLAE